MKLHEYKRPQLKAVEVLYVLGWLERGILKTIRRILPIVKVRKHEIRIDGIKFKFDFNGFQKKDINDRSLLGYIIPLNKQEASELRKKFKDNVRRRKLVKDVESKLQEPTVAQIRVLIKSKVFNKQVEKYQQLKKPTMNLIEAKVEAALFSRLTMKTVSIHADTKDKDNFLLNVGEDMVDKSVTWYKEGCEKGIGVHVPVKREEPKRKKTAEELIANVGKEKPKRVATPKQPTEMKEVEYASIKDAAKATESCIAIISKKKWIVSVKGSWAIQRSIMDKCEAGLILVIRDQGFYLYPKSMWNEFDSIFKSSTYDAGKPYSQSVLPKKFAKYFTKFK